MNMIIIETNIAIASWI